MTARASALKGPREKLSNSSLLYPYWRIAEGGSRATSVIIVLCGIIILLLPPLLDADSPLGFWEAKLGIGKLSCFETLPYHVSVDNDKRNGA